MKMEMAVGITGTIMFVAGLILFYSIELGQTDPVLRFIKNVGTFIGLCGMGVILASSWYLTYVLGCVHLRWVPCYLWEAVWPVYPYHA